MSDESPSTATTDRRRTGLAMRNTPLTWTCRKCQAETVGGSRCGACHWPRKPTGAERLRQAKEEARREAALRGELWGAVAAPPCAEGVAAVTSWLNDVISAHSRAIDQDFPDAQKLRLMQAAIKAM